MTATSTEQRTAQRIAMRGAGYYSSNTRGARLVIDAAADLVMEAIAGMDLASPAPFTLADFGAADGGTSLDLMQRAVAAIRGRAADKPVTITYTDLPGNDFSALFQMLQGDDDGLGRQDRVFTFASGTSFYRQILPDSTLHLGFSATAMHWLSRSPGPIARHVHSVGATAAEQAVFRSQSVADWERILLARARELVPGGALVLANFAEDENGHYLGWTGGVNMHDCFARHWRDLLEQGAITEAEYSAATFQQHYKTVDEFAAPFRDPQSPVRRAGLTLTHLSTRVTRCPYAAVFSQEGDARAFARAYLPTLRSWSESTFMGALDASRSLEERRAIIDRFYDAYETDVATSPQGHGMDYVHCFMVVSKA